METIEWRVTFFNKHSSETRSLVVSASSEEEAENKGIDEAEKLNWPEYFRLLDVVKF